jgi:uncharacterized protein with HEPN domain
MSSAPRKWKFRIRHMLEAIARCREFAEGLDESGLSADVLRLHAVCWELMTIGEAARHVPPEVEASYSEVPWAIMRGMRNRIVHGYDQIKVEVVWEVVVADLPPLVPILERILQDVAEST